MAKQKRTARTRAPEAEESAREALARARSHLRAALAEGLEAVRALLDAASLATNGKPADAHPAFARITKSLEAVASQLATDATLVSPPIVDAILDALDLEIERWEQRSETDAEARPVLRAFIGVREILWEFGLRRDPAPSPSRRPRASSPKRRDAETHESTRDGSAPSARRARVQRVDVQG